MTERIRHIQLGGPFTDQNLKVIMNVLRVIDAAHGGEKAFTARVVDEEGVSKHEALDVLDRIWPASGQGRTRLTTTMEKMPDALRQLVVLLASREHARLTMDGAPGDPHLMRAVEELWELIKLCEGADTVVMVSKRNR